METIRENAAALLLRLKVTTRYKGYWSVLTAMDLLAEDESRLTAVTKELYMEIGIRENRQWKTVERNIRTVVQVAWRSNPIYLQKLCGYALTEVPYASDFLSMLFECACHGVNEPVPAKRQESGKLFVIYR